MDSFRISVNWEGLEPRIQQSRFDNKNVNHNLQIASINCLLSLNGHPLKDLKSEKVPKKA